MTSNKWNFDPFKGYKGNLTWLPQRTIFVTVHGSQAYGTNTPESDIDVKGLCIPPSEYYHGFMKQFEQAEGKEPYDMVIYGLQKFFHLASDCNPNIIEVLNTDPEDWVIETPIFRRLWEKRDLFLSRKARFTFSGYAISQLKRIKSHKKWLLEPPDHMPTREEFGLPTDSKMSQSDLGATAALIEANVPLDKNVMRLFHMEQNYQAAKRNWDQYQNWKSTRNEKRASLEAKFGYDCFTDDTEFLTKNGFKKFDDITNDDLLATVYLGKTWSNRNRRYLGLEYQKPTEKFDGIFNGNLYHFKGQHLDVCVTPNHRMIIKKFSRRNGEVVGLTEFETAASLGDSFQFLYAPKPKLTSQNIVIEQQKQLPEKFSFDNYLRLMGWYLSDGCMLFSPKKEPKEIRISQKKFGKLSWNMQRFYGTNKKQINCSIRENNRKPNKYRPHSMIERTLSVFEKSIVKHMFESCGYKHEKHIPEWVYDLSKRQMDILLTALCGGDGTKRTHKTKKESFVYYSNNKKLADDVQILALMCGYETSLYGPFEEIRDEKSIQMYQVHIRKTKEQFRTYTKNNVLNKLSVTNQRIVCFSVPNGTLITRRNGHIAIQGNCKHAMHLVRLMRMCREILTDGKVLVKRPDAEELKAIRSGAWTYEKLIEWADAQEAEMEELYHKSLLPKEPRRVELDKLCQEITEEALKISDLRVSSNFLPNCS